MAAARSDARAAPPAPPVATVGFVGLGHMGSPVAARLHAAGVHLLAFDTDPRRLATFAAAHPGTRAAGSPADLARADVVITMLPDADAVESVVAGDNGDGLLSILGHGAAVIDMGSSDPMRSRALSRRLAEAGIGYLDAPVSGGPARARDGTLAIMVGGEVELFEVHRPLLAYLGRAVTRVGPPGAGHAVKALNNYLSAAGLVACAEALLVARDFGLDPYVVNEVFNNSTGRNHTTEHKARQFMLPRQFAAGFALDLMAKDLATATELGAMMGRDMRLARALQDLWSEADTQLPRGTDHTAMYAWLERAEALPRSRRR